MNFWKDCWNCGHQTLHDRVALDFFPRIVEMFRKENSGKVRERLWAVFLDSYSYTNCKKCGAPSLFVDEYWPKATTFAEEIKEKYIMFDEIKKNGFSESGNFVRSLSYPGFSKDPFPQWTQDLEETYMILFWEVYQAVSLGLNSLAMMGIRAIIDKYATDKIGDVGGFSKKLRILKEKNIINFEQHDLLKVVVDAGSASAHRGFRYNRDQVKTCLQIVEHLIEINKFGDAIKQIKNKTPSRNHKQPA
jgi:hypothetical protein